MDGGSGSDYFFSVVRNTTLPFGPVAKENFDITMLTFDFTCWLNTGEGIGTVSQPAVMLEGKAPVPPWQNDYPLDNTTVTQPPNDTCPLKVMTTMIAGASSQIQVTVSAGTPGLNYVVSVVVTSSSTTSAPRRKQVDCLITIEMPLNPNLVSPSVPAISVTPPLLIGDDDIIPMGFEGRVYVENGTGHAITVTLPAMPTVLQRVAPVDILGTAFAYPITYQAAPGDFIERTSTTFVSNVNYDDLIFEWTGATWIVLAPRYTLLG